MSRLISLAILVAAATACGGGGGGGATGLVYTDPPDGALRLVHNAAKSTTKTVVLDFVVGSTAQTGYSTGFDLPLDTTKVTLGQFTPGTALSPGSSPAAAQAIIPVNGPLTGMLAIGQSQKAAGTGAVTTDTQLAPGTVLFSVELDAVDITKIKGVVFDGSASGFALPSGGLRNKVGLTVVDQTQVKIGKLEIK